jgi:hypothetical protein
VSRTARGRAATYLHATPARPRVVDSPRLQRLPTLFPLNRRAEGPRNRKGGALESKASRNRRCVNACLEPVSSLRASRLVRVDHVGQDVDKLTGGDRLALRLRAPDAADAMPRIGPRIHFRIVAQVAEYRSSNFQLNAIRPDSGAWDDDAHVPEPTRLTSALRREKEKG